jgi:hypothetical protein
LNAIRILTAGVAAVILGLAAAPSAAPADAPSAPSIDGIRCDRAEGSVFHIHQHLALLDHGTPVAIPGNIGIPLLAQCLYWLHTHSPDGLIHIESPKFRTFTLGEFFDVWGQPLGATRAASAKFERGQLRAFVNGLPYAGDPRKIELVEHSVIVLEAGPPYAKPAPFTDWQGQ